jgi:hypothetical protein
MAVFFAVQRFRDRPRQKTASHPFPRNFPLDPSDALNIPPKIDKICGSVHCWAVRLAMEASVLIPVFGYSADFVTTSSSYKPYAIRLPWPSVFASAVVAA